MTDEKVSERKPDPLMDRLEAAMLAESAERQRRYAQIDALVAEVDELRKRIARLETEAQWSD